MVPGPVTTGPGGPAEWSSATADDTGGAGCRRSAGPGPLRRQSGRAAGPGPPGLSGQF